MKERYQNPVIEDELKLKLFSYNSNNRRNFHSVEKIEIYFLDEISKTESNPNGIVLIETIEENIENPNLGEYFILVNLERTKYNIGKYYDIWYVRTEEGEELSTIENSFQIYPDLWYTTTIPIVYDFNFVFRPNKIRKGSKRYLIVDIEPNVPKTSDLKRYYENLAIVSPIKINIEQLCGDCVPEEKDLRIIIENDDVELREKCTGYYFLNTEELDEGIYNVWFTMEFGESTHISDKQQLQIF